MSSIPPRERCTVGKKWMRCVQEHGEGQDYSLSNEIAPIDGEALASREMAVEL